MADAMDCPRSISKDVAALYIKLELGSDVRIRERWQRWWPDVPLVVLPKPYRSLVGPLRDFLDHCPQPRSEMF